MRSSHGDAEQAAARSIHLILIPPLPKPQTDYSQRRSSPWLAMLPGAGVHVKRARARIRLCTALTTGSIGSFG